MSGVHSPDHHGGSSAAAIRHLLLLMAAKRGDGGSLCPSEVARALADDWRPWMGSIRRVASTLVHEGRLRCTQRGLDVDPETARGPIRLSLPESPPP